MQQKYKQGAGDNGIKWELYKCPVDICNHSLPHGVIKDLVGGDTE
jgi:hypothetical protein